MAQGKIRIPDLNMTGTPSSANFLRGDGTWEVPAGTGDMAKAVYDTDNSGVVDNAEGISIVGRNATGGTLYKGTIVYLLLSTGNRPNFVKAQANSEATSAGTMGVILNDILNNADGNCCTIGYIDTLDTRPTATNPFTSDTLVDGDTIYLSPTTAGYITNVKPVAPNHLVYLGKVTRTSPTNGTIVYRVQNGYELEELHNVLINGSLTNNEVLTYETSSSLWKNKTIPTILGYTPENSGNKAINFTTVNDTLYPTVQAVKTYADNLVAGLLDDRGSYNASSNTFPTTGGSGTAGAVLKGDFWYVSVAGTLGGVAVNIGDSFRALTDTPGQTATNWSVLEGNLGYVPYNATNPSGYTSNTGTVTSVSALTLGTTGTDLSSTVATGTTTPVITLNVPTASATNRGVLSSTDWSTFNGKANDANVVHLTGDETIAGVKSFVNTGTGVINGLSFTNSSTNASVGVINLDNTSSGIGIRVSNSSSGVAFVADGIGTSSGFLFAGRNLGGNTFTVNKLGNVTATSFIKSGGTSSQFLKADGSVDTTTYTPSTGGTGYIQNQNASAQPANMWISGNGKFENQVTIGDGITAGNSSLNLLGVSGVSYQWNLYNDANGFTIYSQAGVNALRMVATTGATTFASSVSATSFNSTLGSNFATTSGNVGIGATTLSNKLHILTANNDGLRVESSNSGFIEVGKTSGSRWRFQNDYNASDYFELLYGATGAVPTASRLLITSNGNVLIGTITDNGNKLRVNGTGYFDGGITATSLKTGIITYDTNGLTIKDPTNTTNVWSINKGAGDGTENWNFYNFGRSSKDFQLSNATGVLTLASLAGTGTRTVVADASGNLSAGALHVKTYKAMINIASSVITPTVHVNTTGVTPTISYVGGVYDFAFAGVTGTPFMIASIKQNPSDGTLRSVNVSATGFRCFDSTGTVISPSVTNALNVYVIMEWY